MDELDVKKVQAEAKRKADLANRLLKEESAKATIEAAKAIHEYNNLQHFSGRQGRVAQSLLFPEDRNIDKLPPTHGDDFVLVGEKN